MTYSFDLLFKINSRSPIKRKERKRHSAKKKIQQKKERKRQIVDPIIMNFVSEIHYYFTHL